MKINIHTHCKPFRDEIIIRNGYLALNKEQIQRLPYFVSLGLHPWKVSEAFEKDIQGLYELLSLEKVVVMGEIGIDRAIKTPIPLQVKAFEAQLEIAQALQKPVIIHAVRTYSLFVPFAKKTTVPFIFHQFMGNEVELKQLLSSPSYFSFGKNLWENHANSFNNFKTLPLERIFLETDTLPFPIEKIYLRAAQIKRLEVAQVEQEMKRNFDKIIKS
ncbi:MAG: TatD family hydrolase [Bacteroidia bacterium]